jgi:hypothetical protein
MKPDARVQYPQTHAPTDESLARAIISLADAIAKGDADKLSPMLSNDAKLDLDALLSTGGWDEGTAKIEAVRVVRFDDLTSGGPGGGPGGSGQCTNGSLQIAIQEPGEAYLVGFSAVRTGDKWLFSGAAAPDATRARATEFDGGTESSASPTAAAPSGGAGGDPTEKALVTAYLAIELQKRVMEKAGMTFDLNAAKQQAATMGASGEQLDAAIEQGKALSRSKSIMPDGPILALLFTSMQTIGGGKVTDEQIVQFMSNIISQPEKVLRDALKAQGLLGGGGGGAPAATTPRGGKPGGG